MKKALSVILSLLIVLSAFSGLSIMTAAESVEDFEPADVFERANTMDLTDSGAELDLTESGHYNIAIGKTTITESNYNDVLQDGGSVKYNPSTHVLTLNNPSVNSVNGDDYGVIQIQAEGVTVRGSFHMTRALSQYGLYCTHPVTLDGNFTFYGTTCGILSGEHKLTVASGTLKAVSTGSSEDSSAIYSDDFVVRPTVTKVEMQSKNLAFIGDKFTLDGMRITSPADAFYFDHARTIITGDYSGYVKNAVIEPFSGSYYDLWVGARRVDSENYTDIFGDGKASFNPSTNTLTLNDPTIFSAYMKFNYDTESPYFYKIYSKTDLTLKGSYQMTEADVNFVRDTDGEDDDDLDRAVYVEGNLTLDGDFTLMAATFGVLADGNITVNSGNLTVSCGDYAMTTLEGQITFNNTLNKVDLRSENYPLWAKGLNFGNSLYLTEPAGGGLGLETSSQHYYVVDKNGQKVHHVVIEYKESYTEYSLWVGATKVTSENRNDILNDGGKAKFDPQTNTLTLNDPYITTTYQNSDNTYKIFTTYDLTIKGNYKVTGNATIGVFSSKSLTFNGTFDLKGTSYAVYAGSITLASGSMTARGDGYAALFAFNGDFTVENAVTKADMTGSAVGFFAKDIKFGSNITVTEPASFAIGTDPNLNLKAIYDKDAATYAKHVVIGPKPAPTEPPTDPPTEPPTDPPTEPPTQPPTQAPTEAPETTYNVWVGSTQVTSANKNDILNDGGKAKFDPSTNTLTLNNPTINGSYNLQGLYVSVKIAAITSLTVKGSYHMTSAENTYGVAIKNWNTLTLDGDFTFCGEEAGIYCDGSVVLESGTIEAFATSNDYEGINCGGNLIIHEGLTKLHVTGSGGDYGAIRSVYEPELCAGAVITTPENGVIKKNGYAYTVFDSSDNPANEVIIEIPAGIDLEGEGTADVPYLIKSTEDWNTLAQYIADDGKTSDKFFRMTNNISVSTALASGGKHFSGTFDGDGHTLTLDNMSGAPFSIEGATIKNLMVDGSVSGGRHISGLVGGIGGSAENLIENCVVAATITTNDTYCGGFVGHGGSQAKTTISGCVFSGTINGATAGTFWGWSDSGATPVLINCLDLSDSTQPIGRGEPKNASVTNCYYTKDGKATGGGRPWNNQGKLAYTVTGEGTTLSLLGAPGLMYNKKIYAAQGETLQLKSSVSDKLLAATAGSLFQNGGSLTLDMPAQDVIIKESDKQPYTDNTFISGTAGNSGEGPENLVDGNVNTKWCVSSKVYPMTMTFKTKVGVTPAGYTLTTANDSDVHSERNPVSWTLEGSTDGSSWTTLTTAVNNRTIGAATFTTYAFSLTNPADTAYSYFRFTVSATVANKTFQLSELKIVGTPESVPPTEYNLWVGPTRVTSGNKDDILNDGGKAKFDPETNTLTLDEPVIEGLLDKDGGTYKFYANGMDLTIKGSYHMTGVQGNYALRVRNGSLTLDGDFTFQAYGYGVSVDNSLTITGGSLRAYGKNNNGLYARNGNIVFGSGIATVDAECVYQAVLAGGNIEIADGLKMVTPENGSIGDYNDWAKTVVTSEDFYADRVIIKGEVKYDLWLGDTQVTSLNKDDILNDGGKAKFDPETNTLTLDDPVIEGCPSRGTFSAKIFADGLDLTVRGNYHMIGPEGNYAFRVLNGSLTFDGDFTFQSYGYAVSCSEDLTLAGGSMKAYGKGNCGLRSNSKIIFGSGIKRVEADSESNAMLTEGNIEIDESLKIYTPENGAIGSYAGWGKTIVLADGSVANYVIIEPAGNFHLWLGDTQVTPENKDDILKDGGKAKYDPATNTLTLNEPDITGYTFFGEYNTHTAMIRSEYPLTVKGSYHMTKATYAFAAVFGDKDLTFDGDFTILGAYYGVHSNQNVTISSGVFKAQGVTYGIEAVGDLEIKDGTERVELNGETSAVMSTDGTVRYGETIHLTTPKNGTVKEFLNWTYVFEEDGTTMATAAVFEVDHYPLWLGSTQVNCLNKDDIFNDGGTAKFDPEKNILTLKNPTISDAYMNADDNTTAKIYARGFDLTVKGSYQMAAKSEDKAVAVEGGSLTLDGKFTFMAKSCGVSCDGDVTIASGNVRAVGNKNYGIRAAGKLIIAENAVRVEAQGMTAAVFTDGTIEFGRTHSLTTPKDGVIKLASSGSRIYDADGETEARLALITCNPLLGDADGDDKVTVLDVTYIQKKLASVPLPGAFYENRACVSGQKLSIIDATYIQRWLASISVPYAIGKPMPSGRDPFVIVEDPVIPEDVYTVTGNSEWLGYWGFRMDENVMTKQDDGTYQITFKGVSSPDENVELYILRFNKGDKNDSDMIGFNGTERAYDFGMSDVGDVTVTYDPATGELSVTGDTVVPPAYDYFMMVAAGQSDGNFLHGVNWEINSYENEMTEVEEDVYEITYERVEANSEYVFKFFANTLLDFSWGYENNDYVAVNTEHPATFYDGSDIHFKTDSNSDYVNVTLRLDLSGFDTLKKTGATFKIIVEDDKSQQPTQFED